MTRREPDVVVHIEELSLHGFESGAVAPTVAAIADGLSMRIRTDGLTGLAGSDANDPSHVRDDDRPAPSRSTDVAGQIADAILRKVRS